MREKIMSIEKERPDLEWLLEHAKGGYAVQPGYALWMLYMLEKAKLLFLTDEDRLTPDEEMWLAVYGGWRKTEVNDGRKRE